MKYLLSVLIFTCVIILTAAAQSPDLLIHSIKAKNTSSKSYYINFDRTILSFGMKDTVYQKNCHAYVHQTDSVCYFRVVTPRNYSYIIDEPSGVYYYEVRNTTLFTNYKHRGTVNELFGPYFNYFYDFLEKECVLISFQENDSLYKFSHTLKNIDTTTQSFTKELFVNKNDSSALAETWYGTNKLMGSVYNKIKINQLLKFPNAIDSILLKNQPIKIYRIKNKEEADRNLDKNDSSLLYQKFNNVSFTDLNGNTTNLKTFKANYYIIDFSYLACIPCLILHQNLSKELTYLMQKNIKPITLNAIDKAPQKIKDYLTNSNISVETYLCKSSILKQYEVTSYPKVFVLDKNFKIIKIFSGYNDNIISYIKSLP